jgi:hypothetical protein
MFNWFAAIFSRADKDFQVFFDALLANKMLERPWTQLTVKHRVFGGRGRFDQSIISGLDHKSLL